MDRVRGYVWVRVTSSRPERTLNVLARNGVDARRVRRDADGALVMRLHTGGYRKLKKLAEGGAFEAEILRERGAPRFLRKVKKRYVLLAGLALCFLAVQVSSLFIWQMAVSGNETVPDTVILSELKKRGVSVGACRLFISQEFLSNEMLLAVPELSWLTVNTRGSRAEVLVREERPKPEIADKDEPTLVYAAKGGIITKMTVTGGRKLLSVGDTAAAGDILVTGEMDSISSGRRYVRAEAEVKARTWYELSAKMPLETLEKTYTGRSVTRTALILGGKRINLYFTGGNPWVSYDKITSYDVASLPGGTVLPLTVVKETFEEYGLTTAKRGAEDAELILKARLLSALSETAGGGVISTDYTVSETDGVLTVTLFAECEEDIGMTRALTEDEMTPAGDGGQKEDGK